MWPCSGIGSSDSIDHNINRIRESMYSIFISCLTALVAGTSWLILIIFKYVDRSLLSSISIDSDDALQCLTLALLESLQRNQKVTDTTVLLKKYSHCSLFRSKNMQEDRFTGRKHWSSQAIAEEVQLRLSGDVLDVSVVSVVSRAFLVCQCTLLHLNWLLALAFGLNQPGKQNTY